MSNTMPSRKIRICLKGFIVLLLLVVSGRVDAFAVFAYTSGSETLYSKWGDNHAGTVGGIVTWSFIPPGTAGSGYCGTACPGSSVSSINMEISPGGGFISVPLISLESQITAMMAEWSAVSGIQYIKVSDNGAAINDPTAIAPNAGQIRIGVFAFSSGGGGVGYAPPPNGGSGAGDIILDANSYYQNYALAEGASFATNYAPNDFQGLILHELGHALGLAHPVYDGRCPVMQPNSACDGIINRQLDPDDRNGAIFLYDRIFGSGFE
ncbi:matrixin family metalloprotease [Pseudolysobacter antarcticus]|uniref:Matrixin family metalloprotease n=1 Tax=Pseudolysobacter antarcticus TaxID=2511995 RepID=A0A411HFF6_9GAMM|nr:matrixin family metalloprotease [Pseudolysobacter antarcticus]QBB69184.1 matrixin family metalloprotease [Pseudolysobacter antarcticus]